MAQVIKTFPIIQCSPPSGKPAKSNKPLSTGGAVAQKHSEWKGSHSLGPCWGQQGNISVPPLTGQEGRRQFLSWQTYLRAHGCPCTQTHPRTNPWLQTSQLQAYRAGEGGGQGPHSGWRVRPSQDHTEQKSCPGTHGYSNWE